MMGGAIDAPRAQTEQASRHSPPPDELSDHREELAALRTQTADTALQLDRAEARCEELRGRLAAAEGQLTSTKVAATHATMAAQVCRSGRSGFQLEPDSDIRLTLDPLHRLSKSSRVRLRWLHKGLRPDISHPA